MRYKARIVKKMMTAPFSSVKYRKLKNTNDSTLLLQREIAEYLIIMFSDIQNKK